MTVNPFFLQNQRVYESISFQHHSKHLSPNFNPYTISSMLPIVEHSYTSVLVSTHEPSGLIDIKWFYFFVKICTF